MFLTSMYLLTLPSPLFVLAPEGFVARGPGRQTTIPWEQVAAVELKRVMGQTMMALSLRDADMVRDERLAIGGFHRRWARLVFFLTTVMSALLLMRPGLLQQWRAHDDAAALFRLNHRMYGAHYLIPGMYLDRPLKDGMQLVQAYCRHYGCLASDIGAQH